MSEATDLNVREQIVRIDRMIEESRKFSEETRKFITEQHKLTAEQSKLAAEQGKLTAEQGKLTAEAAKLSRERGIQTLLAITGLIGGIITVAQLFLRLRGVP